MSRPHICFVQAQHIPWSGSGFAELSIQVEVKVLSRDHESGAVTEIMRLPRGMQLAGPMYFPCVFEFYVLDGAFTVGNQIYKKDSYAYWPPGYAWSELTSEGRTSSRLTAPRRGRFFDDVRTCGAHRFFEVVHPRPHRRGY